MRRRHEAKRLACRSCCPLSVCITVLSQVMVPRIEAIYEFFEEIDTSFRLLPIYKTGYAHQQDTLTLRDDEIIQAFKKVVNLWLRSESSIVSIRKSCGYRWVGLRLPAQTRTRSQDFRILTFNQVRPIQDYIAHVVAKLGGAVPLPRVPGAP